MKILATNDDGIYAPGLWALVKELRDVANVTVVAPDREQSGVGSSVTLHHPVRIKEVKPVLPDIKAYAVEGTPADSVILAVRELMKDGVGLVVSGINEGANLGNDVFISGTVGAAMQGYLYRLPVLAISLAATENFHFQAAAKLAKLLAIKIKDKVLPERVFLNINLPNLPLEGIKGIEIARLGERDYNDTIKEGHDGKRKYYWIVRGQAHWRETSGTDIWVLRQGKISITPLPDNSSVDSVFPLLKSLTTPLFEELRTMA